MHGRALPKLSNPTDHNGFVVDGNEIPDGSWPVSRIMIDPKTKSVRAQILSC